MSIPPSNLGPNHDLHIQDWIRHNVNHKDVFYDIGANTGIMSRVALEITKNVYSFEPNMTIPLSNLLHVMRFAAWDKDTYMHMEFPNPEESGEGEVYEGCRVDKPVVTGKTLNGLLLCIPPPTVIKSDTQGSEYNWIMGAEKALETVRCMVIECCEPLLQKHGHSEEDLKALVTGLGFNIEYQIGSDLFLRRG